MRTTVVAQFASGRRRSAIGILHESALREEEVRDVLVVGLSAYPWRFAFVFAHGASALAAFRIRATRDPVQIRTLLDVSSLAIGVMYIGLLLLLIGGIAAGIVGDHFDAAGSGRRSGSSS